jgi:hypothetical protein
VRLIGEKIKWQFFVGRREYAIEFYDDLTALIKPKGMFNTIMRGPCPIQLRDYQKKNLGYWIYDEV